MVLSRLLSALLVAGTAAALPTARVLNSTVEGTVVRVHATMQAAAAAQDLALDVWKKDLVSDNSSLLMLDLQVAHGDLAAVKAIEGLTVTHTMHEDLRANIEAQAAQRTGKWDQEESKRVVGAKADPFFDEFRVQAEIEAYMLLQALEHPEIAQFEASIGQTLQGRSMPAIVIGGQAGGGGPTVFNQCGVHSREWITYATCMYLVTELLESQDPAIRRLVQEVKFVFAVIGNPDGYAETWTASGRLHRKNMRAAPAGVDPTCIGVDLNRNFDDHWNLGVGGCSSTNPCSQTFHGEGPASEPEVANLQRYLIRFLETDSVIAGIDWHSYGNLILRPWGWSNPATAVPPNNDFVTRVGAAMSDAMFEVNGQRYTNQPSYGLYPVCGSASDYLGAMTGSAGEQGVGICVELRPSSAGGGGFVLPDDQIVATGEENLVGFIVYVEDVLAQFRVQNNATKTK